MTTYGWVGLSGGLTPGPDELYTPLSAVEAGLRRYRKCFAGKTVICNCDDPSESSFVKYFIRGFDSLGLKKLIAVSCHGSPAAGEEVSLFPQPGIWDGPVPAHRLTVTRRGRKLKRMLTPLKGGGDFRSPECIRLLKQSDIAVTVPPFSLFGEYLRLTVSYGRSFLVLGPVEAAVSPEVLPLIRAGRVRPDFADPCGEFLFRVPGDPSRSLRPVNALCWFTDLTPPGNG
ncbi:MAG: hypothetical protein IJS14_09190 [Lentisphaeria bacterium]|nr:hypothetical protein [Lentisphaeria bacterium]